MKYTDIDEVYRLGSYKNSISDKRNELVYNSNEDGNSIISSPAHTVIMGDDEKGDEPVGMMSGDDTLQSTSTNYLLMNPSREDRVLSQEDVVGGNLLESILSKVNLVIQKIDSSNTSKYRSQTEIYVHLLLYFITGLFILYVLFYVFQLGKQEIKITLAR